MMTGRRMWGSAGAAVLGTVALSVLFAGCGRGKGGRDEEQSLTVKGSDTLLHLSTEWAEAFMDANPDIDVAVTGGGSGTGIAALLNGTTDVANASRKIKQKELDNAKASGKQIKEIKVARDGISVVVHPSNPVNELTMDQLKKIFAGAYTKWSQVGGPDTEIIVLSRDHSSGTYAFFKKRVLGKLEYATTARFVPSNSAIVNQASMDHGAIGYVGLGYYENARGRIKGIAVVDGGGQAVLPSVKSVSNGSYPISRTLQVYVVGDPSGAVKKYIDFALSPEGQAIVGKKGFVPLK